MRLRQLWLIVSLLCCLAAAGEAADVHVTAELNPTAFALNQEAEFIITVNGVSSAEPAMPAADGLRFRSLGQSSQTSWINGKMSASVSFSFAVQAEKIGQHTIGSVKVRADGKDYATQSVRCAVSPAQNFSRPSLGQQPGGGSSAPLSAEDAENIGFMRIQPETERFYAGQLVPFTIKAYFRPGKRIHVKTAPRFTGDNFILHFLDQEPIQQSEQVNGERYTALIWNGSLSAVKEGAALLAVETDADLMMPEQSQHRFDPFGSSLLNDPFFDQFLGRYTRREIKLVSPEKSVTALPLPGKNRPADFKGAVGMFSLTVAASPTEGKTGEPIMLKVNIVGKGNFDRVQMPELTDSTGWKVYPASDRAAGQSNGKGEKKFEQAIVPVSSSLAAVPPLCFSYFDPIANDYVTLTSEPIPLKLLPAVESVQPPAEKNEPPQKNRKLPAASEKKKRHYVVPPFDPAQGESVQIVRPLYQKPRFQAVIAGAGCCLAVGLLLDLRRKKLVGNPGLVLRRQVERQKARHYQEMRAAIATQDQERFRRHCQEAIQQQAGAAWGRAAEAITGADLQERLPADSPLLGIFARLEQSGYADQQLERIEMETILQTTRQELARLS